ncbi:hypothetical protein ACFL1D_02450 [Candidatus Omnitrophota bacterium]
MTYFTIRNAIQKISRGLLLTLLFCLFTTNCFAERYYFLSPFTGTGTREDPYRPLVSEYGKDWGLIDLRPDIAKPDGWAICYLDADTEPIDAKLVPLGTSLTVNLNSKAKRNFAKKLGITLKKNNLRDILAEILIEKKGAGLVNPLQAGADGKYRIYFGDLIFGDPEPEYKHSTISDSFNRSDADALGTSSEGWWSWVEYENDIDIVSNQARTTTQYSDNSAYANAPEPATANHYAQAKVWISGDKDTWGGPTARVSTSAETFYSFCSSDLLSQERWQMRKQINGAWSEVASYSTGWATPNGATLRIEVDGNSLIGKQDGVTKISTTDSSITGNTKTGIFGHQDDAGRYIRFDDFESDDLNKDPKQTFHWITPIEVSLTASGWADYDLDDYIAGLGSDVTGVIVHVVADGTYYFGIRTDGGNHPTSALYSGSHAWAISGVNAATHVFEMSPQNTSNMHVYIVGYTTTGVVFFTNTIEYNPGTSWGDLDTSSDVPSNAIGLIWEFTSPGSGYSYGVRNNGSTDDFYRQVTYHSWAIIGCDTSQICDGRESSDTIGFYLIGYITDGAVFHTNGISRSLGSTGTWTDITCSTGAGGVFIDVVSEDTGSFNWDFGLRRMSDTWEDIYYENLYHPFAFIGCDNNYKIQGKIADTRLDFYEVGYATSPFSMKLEGIEAEGIDVD